MVTSAPQACAAGANEDGAVGLGIAAVGTGLTGVMAGGGLGVAGLGVVTVVGPERWIGAGAAGGSEGEGLADGAGWGAGGAGEGAPSEVAIGGRHSVPLPYDPSVTTRLVWRS
jgi:hypothetical protein